MCSVLLKVVAMRPGQTVRCHICNELPLWALNQHFIFLLAMPLQLVHPEIIQLVCSFTVIEDFFLLVLSDDITLDGCMFKWIHKTLIKFAVLTIFRLLVLCFNLLNQMRRWEAGWRHRCHSSTEKKMSKLVLNVSNNAVKPPEKCRILNCDPFLEPHQGNRVK